MNNKPKHSVKISENERKMAPVNLLENLELVFFNNEPIEPIKRIKSVKSSHYSTDKFTLSSHYRPICSPIDFFHE